MFVFLRVHSWFRHVSLLGCLLALAPITHAAETGAGAPIRVVSQTVGTDELLVALAEPEQIAALSHIARDPAFSGVAAEAAHYPQLELGDAESILRYTPTLVLAADYSRAELIAQLRRAGVRVLIFDRYNTLDDAYGNLRRLAKELGPEAVQKAERIIADCRQRVTALATKLRGATPVRVIAPSTYGVIPGADTTFQDLCDHAGAINLATTIGKLRGHQPPPNEQLLSWPIERVVVAGHSVKEAIAPYRSLPPYQFLTAVRENRVALIEPYMLASVTHRRIDGYERFARELHPELFAR